VGGHAATGGALPNAPFELDAIRSPSDLSARPLRHRDSQKGVRIAEVTTRRYLSGSSFDVFAESSLDVQARFGSLLRVGPDVSPRSPCCSSKGGEETSIDATGRQKPCDEAYSIPPFASERKRPSKKKRTFFLDAGSVGATDGVVRGGRAHGLPGSWLH
jgi:hypothetical protein